MKTSEVILLRLKAEADKFGSPERRHATLERLEEACNKLETGFRQSTKNGSKVTTSRTIYKINPSNIEKVVRENGWPGPTRSFIANRESGLLDYVHCREEERVAKSGITSPLDKSNESILGKIDDVELRQMVRREIERRRRAEQELKLLKEGLRKIPQIDIRTLTNKALAKDSLDSSLSGPLNEHKLEYIQNIRSLLVRLSKRDLRSLGLKRVEGDIVSATNAPVVLERELRSIAMVSDLPESILESE